MWRAGPLVLFFLATANAACPGGYLPLGDSCYLFETDSYSSREYADEFCAERGGRVPIFHDAACSDFGDVASFMASQGYERSFWLAGSDEDYEGIWLWSDKTPVRMGPPFWAYSGSSMEPTGAEIENCLSMSASQHFYFDDIVCNAFLYVVCQADA